MHAIQVRRPLVSFAAALAALLISFSAGSADNPRERAALLASQAEKILNTWTGRNETIVQAENFIEEALALDPNSGHAMVEKGRATLMRGATDTGYSPRAAQAAEALFKQAAQLDPPYGRGFVLLGHLYTTQGMLDEASLALTRAESLVPNDPWLKLNWGAYFVAKGHPEREPVMAEIAIATGTTNPKALKAAYEIVLKSELRKGNRAKADEIYAKAVQIQSDDPWIRGNYAQNVMLYFGDFEAGERLAREALEVMDYGHARGSLSLALYGKWAQAEMDGKSPAEKEALFEVAHRNDPGGRNLPSCAMKNKRVGFVFDAVFRKGIERQSLRQC
jgi:Tfp pilus assembly protein PilF